MKDPDRISAICNESFSLFVSNLPETTTSVELEAMFCRAGRIVDSFIPINRITSKKRGFGFIRFKSEIEALKAIDLRNGSKWGGKKITVNLARPRTRNRVNRSTAPAVSASSSNGNPWFSQSNVPPMVNLQKNDREGWIVKSNQQAAVMVAPWVVEEEKKTLALCLVGFMKSPSGGIREVEVWLANTWGGHPISIKTLDTDVLLLQLSSDVELEGILSGAREFRSPFIAIERWMEVIGAPP